MRVDFSSWLAPGGARDLRRVFLAEARLHFEAVNDNIGNIVEQHSA